jgi:hypothetical protein
MTTYHQDTIWGRKYTTILHLIYRIKRGKLEALELHETREQAEAALAIMNSEGSGGWSFADVRCGGWGIVDNAVRHNEPSELADDLGGCLSEQSVKEALVEAAVAVHPGWRNDGNGLLTKLDPIAPDVPVPLLDWFRQNYPQQAEQITAERTREPQRER